MKYIASCSFGKDSLAAIHLRMENKESVDKVIYCRIMYNDTISAEVPEHEVWIYETAIPLLKSRYGLETQIVQADRTYYEQFYTKYQKGQRTGENYGFPSLREPWCNSRLKVPPLKAFQKSLGAHKSIIGIAADETNRIKRQTVQGGILPLVEYGVTEQQAMEICKKNGLLSPAYNNGRFRLGCWFCHNQRISELRRLRHEYPSLWNELLSIAPDSPRTFKPDYSMAELEYKFCNEDRQISFSSLIQEVQCG